jgi:putative ABC transport system permease protein
VHTTWVVSALLVKTFRDVVRLKGQASTIALVLGCGVLAILMMSSTHYSIKSARDAYYAAYRFADVFVRLERAPDGAAASLRSIRGVVAVQTRIVLDVMVPKPDQLEPLLGRVISLPHPGEPALNGVYLASGRLPNPNARDEVLILRQFAEAHGLGPGDQLPIVLSGVLHELSIVGIGMSPEYVFATSGQAGAADAKKFVVIWMPKAALAAAARMEGAFNDVSLRVAPGIAIERVLADVDLELAGRGALPAVPRERQPSHHMLSTELGHLGSLALSIPLAFLGVAAFLVNVVVSRLVFLERTEIAVLKAIGYSKARIASHYLGLVSLIVLLGTAVGIVSGKWAGSWMTGVYMRAFSFPVGENRLPPQILVLAALVAFAAAAFGALGAVLRVARLPPAQAMLPPAPLHYRRSLLSSPGWSRYLGTGSMMILREITRRPVRFFMSSLGIAMGIAIFILGNFSWDSFDHLFREVFPRQQRGDLVVSFIEPRPTRAVRELAQLPGVIDAEGYRTVPVRFRHGSRSKDGVVIALPARARLRQVLHQDRTVIELPDYGLMMTDRLAERLGLSVGDEVELELHEGDWSSRRVQVVRLIDESFGIQAYADFDWLHRVLGEAPRVDSVSLRLDELHGDEVRARFKDQPFVRSSSRLRELIENFERQTGDMIGVITLLLAISAASISIGVVYNNARVALSLRSRELASLRVLGFTRREISSILLGELWLQVMVGIPLGMTLGTWWAHLQAMSFEQETLRFPVHIAASTYGKAGIIALVAGVSSAMLVRRRLDHLDLVSVLKARD